MRTPIQSTTVIAKKVLLTLQCMKKGKDMEMLIRCCKIIISTLYFVESFTEDLLNISQF